MMATIVDHLPPLESLYVYGPLGFVFAAVLVVALDHYWTVRRPFARKKAALELEIQAEQREYTATAKQVIARLAESSEKIAVSIDEVKKVQDNQGVELEDHRKRLECIQADVTSVKVTLDGITK